MRALLMLAVVFLGACEAGHPDMESLASARNRLSAVPKARMVVEQGVSTFAPTVPPAITRSDPRIVEVHWQFKSGEREISPGVVYKDAWTIEGSVPGPMLRLRVGDVLRLYLTNNDPIMPHNIDFHSILGPGGGAGATLVEPGQTSIIEARMVYPGLFMYHCAVKGMVPMHIANGMYGAILVEDVIPLPKVDKEFYLTQSEWYATKEADGKYAFDYERGMLRHPTYRVFNGAEGAITGDRALQANVGDRLRFYVMNEGPNDISSFHIIGTIFDKVYREGDIVSPPRYGIQTTTIPSGGSTVIDLMVPVPGVYTIVDHAIFGLYQGLVGELVVKGPANHEIFEVLKSATSTDHQHQE